MSTSSSPSARRRAPISTRKRTIPTATGLSMTQTPAMSSRRSWSTRAESSGTGELSPDTKGVRHMDNQTQSTGDTEILFLTDQNGNAYVVASDVIVHAKVPDELKTEIRELATADTKGYGNADYMLSGIL